MVLKPSYSVAYSVGNGFFMVNEGGIPVLQYIIMGNWKVVDQTGKVVLELGDYNNFLCDPFIIYFGLGESFTLYTPAGALIVGPVMRPVTDKLKISREKLSYLVDSTSAPVTGIAVVSSWAQRGNMSKAVASRAL